MDEAGTVDKKIIIFICRYFVANRDLRLIVPKGMVGNLLISMDRMKEALSVKQEPQIFYD